LDLQDLLGQRATKETKEKKGGGDEPEQQGPLALLELQGSPDQQALLELQAQRALPELQGSPEQQGPLALLELQGSPDQQALLELQARRALSELQGPRDRQARRALLELQGTPDQQGLRGQLAPLALLE
jgi:hypothetical protein